MEKETKKSLASGGIIAGGLVAAAMTLGIMQGDTPKQVEQIDKQAVARSVAAEVRREIQAEKREYVEAPDKVHTDTMLWLNRHELKVNEKISEQEKKTERLTQLIEQLAKKNNDPNDRLITAIEALASNQKAVEKRNEELGKSVEELNRRMLFQDSQLTEDLTRVFEGFDRRFKKFEGESGNPTVSRPTVGMPISGYRLVSDEVEKESETTDERLARIEELLTIKIVDEPNREVEGITVDWGDKKIVERPVNDHPAPPQPEPEPKEEGLIRSVVGQTGDTVTGVSDVAASTINKATNTANGLVKDLTRTTGNALNGTADTAGTAIGGTAGIASEQGKKAWKKFW